MSEASPYTLLPLHCPECGKEYFTLGEQQEHHLTAHERPLVVDLSSVLTRVFGAAAAKEYARQQSGLRAWRRANQGMLERLQGGNGHGQA